MSVSSRPAAPDRPVPPRIESMRPVDPAGLDAAAVASRRQLGQTNAVVLPTSRSLSTILRTNIVTRFNVLLGSLFVVIAVTGPLQDGLFALVIVVNSGIAIAAELRAKRALEQINLVSAATATVIRAGHTEQIPVADVVLDDIVEAGRGDQIVADGRVLPGSAADIDESLLTGESDPVPRLPGVEVRSGSSVVSGTVRYVTTRVGADSYANVLAREARRFSVAPSELRSGIDRMLRWITWALVPTGALLVITQYAARGTADAIRSSVAAVVTMVPEGLVLLVSAAFALAAVRLARRNVLLQQIQAVETLARVDVVCFDKTGTLTDGTHLRVVGREQLDAAVDDVTASAALAALAAADRSPNPTMRAVAALGQPQDGWAAAATVPFSSAQRWAAADLGPHGWWLLGAPDTILGSTGGADVLARVATDASRGRRVLLLARAGRVSADEGPEDVRPAALLTLEDELRADAAQTVRFFAEQGVALKVFSGDHPATVAAVAAAVGIDSGMPAVDAGDLAVESVQAYLAGHSVFGRVSPAQKQALVEALRDRGHCVAMVGDGVNDVPALKAADIGVAFGSATQAARAVSEIVLVDDRFASLAPVVHEGRRVVANIERTASLFLTKSVYALLLALAIGVAGLPFPFLPRHLTVVATLTLGIPGVVLALGAAAPRVTHGFVRRVVRFAVPAGLTAAVATFVAYALARTVPEVSLAEARTSATMSLLAVGLALLALLAPRASLAFVLIVSMVAAYVAILAVPFSRHFFALDAPPAVVVLAALGAAALGMWGLELGTRARAGLLSRSTSGGGVAGQADDIHALLRAGEGASLEFKASLRWDFQEQRANKALERAVAKTVAGLLNGQGGTLLIGVGDDGEVIGLQADYATLPHPNADGYERHLRQVLSAVLGAGVQRFVTVRFVALDGKAVCRVDVAASDTPAYLREGNEPRLYLRIGNATSPLPVDEAVRYVGTRWVGRATGNLLEAVFGRWR